MKTYTVLYEDFYGTQKTFGPFKTFSEAYDWMKVYVQYRIQIAKINGVEYVAKDNGSGSIEINEYGTWKVLENHTLDFDASKPVCDL